MKYHEESQVSLHDKYTKPPEWNARPQLICASDVDRHRDKVSCLFVLQESDALKHNPVI